MSIPKSAIGILLVGTIVFEAGMASGQNYPNKPIRMVTGESGGGTDLTTRIIAQGLTVNVGQQVIVDNRGGSGIIQGEIVMKAPPDGYTLLVNSGSLWIGQLLLQGKTPYDVTRDFAPITLAVTSPNVLLVYPSLPAKSVKELVALARAKPGELNYASGGSGSGPHLAGELFKAMANVNILRVSYRGTGPAINDLIGGQVQLMFPNAASVAPHVKSGRLRALAVTSLDPSALAPGLPTVAASGLPGYEAVSTYGVFTPARTPKAIINLLNQEILRFLKTAEAKEKFLSVGSEVVGGSPEQLGTKVQAEMARLGKVIKDAGIRAD